MMSKFGFANKLDFRGQIITYMIGMKSLNIIIEIISQLFMFIIGSSEVHTCYFYKKKTSTNLKCTQVTIIPGRQNYYDETDALVSCDPLFREAVHLATNLNDEDIKSYCRRIRSSYLNSTIVDGLRNRQVQKVTALAFNGMDTDAIRLNNLAALGFTVTSVSESENLLDPNQHFYNHLSADFKTNRGS